MSRQFTFRESYFYSKLHSTFVPSVCGNKIVIFPQCQRRPGHSLCVGKWGEWLGGDRRFIRLASADYWAWVMGFYFTIPHEDDDDDDMEDEERRGFFFCVCPAHWHNPPPLDWNSPVARDLKPEFIYSVTNRGELVLLLLLLVEVEWVGDCAMVWDRNIKLTVHITGSGVVWFDFRSQKIDI